MRDFQRARLYAWEKAVLDYSTPIITIDEARMLVGKVWRRTHQRREAPRIELVARSNGVYYSRGHTIHLPERLCMPWYVIHETTHAMIDNELAWHGPEFCALYADLLQRFDNWRAVRSSMKYFNLKVAT